MTATCPRCGMKREINTSRHTTLCHDCRTVMSPEEKAKWR